MQGTVTCPHCGHKQTMPIPEKACQAMYRCEKCGRLVMAKKSCCIFCDYGDTKCPMADKHHAETK